MTEQHRDWIRDETDPTAPWMHRDTGETTEMCHTCLGPSLWQGRPSSLLLCGHCHRTEGRVLDGIVQACEDYDGTPLGTITGHAARRQYGAADFGLTTETTSDGITGPADVHDALLSWAALWVDAGAGAENIDVVDYLKSRLLWAGQTREASRWHEYRAAMRKLRHAARRVAGLLPSRENAPCIYCGGTVVRDWATPWWEPRESGLSEYARCSNRDCGSGFWAKLDDWTFAQRDYLEEIPARHPDAHVTLENAHRIWPDVPLGTMRKWVDRGRLVAIGTDERGRHTYQVRKLARLVERRLDTRRRGRRAIA